MGKSTKHLARDTMYLKKCLHLLLLPCLYTIRAIENEDIDIETCECIPFRDCPWALKVYDLINAGNGGGLIRVFVTNVCDRKNKHVWCCQNTKGESVYPSVEGLKTLKEELEGKKPETRFTDL